MDEKRGSGAPGSPGNSEETDGAGSESLDARRKRLDTELSARRKVAPEGGSSREASKGYALAVKLSSEFIAGLIVFLLLGFCAGVLNVLRSTGAVAQPKPATGSQTGPRGEDDGK